MKRFLQIHALTSYPPSNLNRDDLGRPKTAVMGGRNRLRISSQCLKRSWRTSDIFSQSLEGKIADRTKRIGYLAQQDLLAAGVEKEKASEVARKIGEAFGKLTKSNDAGEFLNETVSAVTPQERDRIQAIVEAIVDDNDFAFSAKDILLDSHSAVDVAMFGRMLASSPKYNTEAAVQVAHALTTHEAIVEDDFFTAVDDLKDPDDDRGSAHMGETEFGAGVFYLYVCVDREQLVDNLGGDAELARKGIECLLEAIATVSPSGKQNSFGSRARADYVRAELGNQQPRSLSAAFIEPVKGRNQAESSIAALEDRRSKFDSCYGACVDGSEHFNVLAGEGSLKAVKSFAVGGLE